MRCDPWYCQHVRSNQVLFAYTTATIPTPHARYEHSFRLPQIRPVLARYFVPNPSTQARLGSHMAMTESRSPGLAPLRSLTDSRSGTVLREVRCSRQEMMERTTPLVGSAVPRRAVEHPPWQSTVSTVSTVL
jgi:hypothetical protein